jgi:hypothetical protein
MAEDIGLPNDPRANDARESKVVQLCRRMVEEARASLRLCKLSRQAQQVLSMLCSAILLSNLAKSLVLKEKAKPSWQNLGKT